MWHGYVLLEKPAALSMGDWRTVLQALAVLLPRRPQSSMPAYRLQARPSLDNTKVILEAVFDLLDLDADDLGRLCRYISEALDGAYTPEQVREALRNHVTIAAPGGSWRESAALTRAYLAAHLEEWEEAEP